MTDEHGEELAVLRDGTVVYAGVVQWIRNLQARGHRVVVTADDRVVITPPPRDPDICQALKNVVHETRAVLKDLAETTVH